MGNDAREQEYALNRGTFLLQERSREVKTKVVEGTMCSCMTTKKVRQTVAGLPVENEDFELVRKWNKQAFGDETPFRTNATKV